MTQSGLQTSADKGDLLPVFLVRHVKGGFKLQLSETYLLRVINQYTIILSPAA